MHAVRSITADGASSAGVKTGPSPTPGCSRPAPPKELLDLPGFEGIECFGCAADEGAADKDLRNGRDIEAGIEGCPDLAAPGIFLVVGRIEVDRTARDAAFGKEFPNRPAELAPLEGEQRDRLIGDNTQDAAVFGRGLLL
jgi:hypothetical protein